MAKLKSLVYGVVLLAGFATLSGCEKAEDLKLASAQACMDSASTAADADRCVAMVEGLSTPGAYSIRCSAHFVAQGFTGQRIADALDRLKNKTNGNDTDPTAALMGYVVFPKHLTGHSIQDALDNCLASGVTSMHRIAQIAELATFVARVGLPAGVDLPAEFDPSDPGFALTAGMEQALIDLANSGDATTQTQIGNMAVAINDSFCAAGSNFSSNDVCTKLGNAIQPSATPQQVGADLLALLLDALTP